MPAANDFERRIIDIESRLKMIEGLEHDLEGAEDLPSVFAEVYKGVAPILGFCKSIGDHIPKSHLDEEAYKGIRPFVEDIRKKAFRLDEIFYEVVCNAKTTRQDHYCEVAGKNEQVEYLMKEILKNALEISAKLGFEWVAEETVGKLQKALEEVLKIPSSLPKDQAGKSLNTNNNYGSGNFSIGRIKVSGKKSRDRMTDRRNPKRKRDGGGNPNPKVIQDEDIVEQNRNFGCPFYKLDPYQYSGCLTHYSLKRISDVKQHIQRCHRRSDYFCYVCSEEFSEISSWREHTKNCHVSLDQQVPEPDTFSVDELEQLNYMPRGADEVRKYFWLWEHFFPSHPQPETPYVQDVINEFRQLLHPEFLELQRTGTGSNFPAHMQHQRRFRNRLDQRSSNPGVRPPLDHYLRQPDSSIVLAQHLTPGHGPHLANYAGLRPPNQEIQPSESYPVDNFNFSSDEEEATQVSDKTLDPTSASEPRDQQPYVDFLPPAPKFSSIESRSQPGQSTHLDTHTAHEYQSKQPTDLDSHITIAAGANPSNMGSRPQSGQSTHPDMRTTHGYQPTRPMDLDSGIGTATGTMVSSIGCLSQLGQPIHSGTHTVHEHQSTRPTDIDSDMGTVTETKLSHLFGQEMLNAELGKNTDNNVLPNADARSDCGDTKTEFSEGSSRPTEKAEQHSLGFATALYNSIGGVELGQEAFERICALLPDLLKSFSIRIGFESASETNRIVMQYVRKHRSDIARSFSELKEQTNDGLSEDGRDGSQIVPWEDRIMLLHDRLKVLEFEEPEMHELGEHELYDFEDTSIPDIHPSQGSAESELDTQSDHPKFPDYKELAMQTEAYEWLVSRIRLELRLGPAKSKTIEDIRDVIKASLKDPLKVSKKTSSTSHNIAFKFEWHLKHFLSDQQSILDGAEAFGRVITLTGFSQDAQVLTCEQYLTQTWPTTGKQTLNFIRDVLEHETEDQESYSYSDGTQISILLQESEFTTEVTGTIASIMEIGEQLAWLSSALCSYPRRRGLVYCTPILKKIDSPTMISTFGIDFVFENIQDPALSLFPSTGQCWHNLFVSPVIVKGYPIIAKSQPNTGVEIPLNIMAALAGTHLVDSFNDRTVIKGFSKLLIPTRKSGGILFWHMFYEEGRGRISYPYPSQYHMGLIDNRQLEELRHVLGWSPNVDFCAGSAHADYHVEKTFLADPDPDSPLSGINISRGAHISGGPKHVICKKDAELQIRVNVGSMQGRLRGIDQTYVLFWDVADERGWLVNGSTALLHLVKASLEHNGRDKFRNDFIYNKGRLMKQDIATPESAIKELLSADNLDLLLYKNEDERFGDRVNIFLNILEKMTDHQQQIGGRDGINLATTSRKCLAGWDFHDLTQNYNNRIYSSMAILGENGTSWVDLIRSIQAVTFFGRGFGQLIKAVSTNGCQQWTELPKNKFYIAACISDLKEKINRFEPPDGHTRLGRDIIWHTETTIFDPCDCDNMAGMDCREPVQSLLPNSMSTLIRSRERSIPKDSPGAVIFGQHSKLDWFWTDRKDGQRKGEPSIPKSISQQDSGIGPSTTSSTPDHNAAHSVSTSGTSSLETGQSPMTSEAYPNRDSYSVGIICALHKELLAVRTLYDETFTNPAAGLNDRYVYAAGRMGQHLVVSSCLARAEYGTNSAADCASNMDRSFPKLKACLLVGIGGGVPSSANDIRLGDVVISDTVIQYDLGKEHKNGQFQRTGVVQGPPRSLRTVTNFIQSSPSPSAQTLKLYIDRVARNAPDEERKKYTHPGKDSDILFEQGCESCPDQNSCSCAPRPMTREPRTSDNPVIHYGPVASGNRVVKDVSFRDKLWEQEGVLCFEMEAAGVMNILPTLVIRGICDYSDCHKNKRWQEYAAATAAAYARMFLDYLPQPAARATKRRKTLAWEEEHEKKQPRKGVKTWKF